MTERTLGCSETFQGRPARLLDGGQQPRAVPPDFFAIFAQLIAEVVEVDSTNHCYCAWGRGVAGVG
jgi:hypothetical protein